MKFTLSWLEKFLDTNYTLDEICDALTESGTEVEKVVDRTIDLSPFIVAQIKSIRKHPNADKLNLCQVDYGSGSDEIVCGAPNVREGLKVILAPLGTVMPGGEFKIEKRKIRGIESVGMLCSAAEIGLGADGAGIVELPDHVKTGEKLLEAMPQFSDPMIEVEVTPNRPDCLSVHGIARDIAAYGVGSLKKVSVNSVKSEAQNPIEVKIAVKEKCRLFVHRYFSDVQNVESSQDIKALLEAIGEVPISASVDITNYMNYSFGRPMHVYDADKIKGGLVVAELDKPSKLLGLDGKEYSLEAGDLVIRDDEKICGLAGILGGETTKCDESTKNILLEAAVFDSVAIAKTARRINVETRAKYVFERGVDHNFTSESIDIASDLLSKLCGGAASKKTFVGEESKPLGVLKFNLSKSEKLLGISLDKDVILDIFKRLRFVVKDIGENNVEVTIPSWRHDIKIQEDLVEEIARIHGYKNIPEKMLPASYNVSKGSIGDKDRKNSNVRRILASSGYNELITWSFMSSKVAKKFGIYEEDMLLKNPISDELDMMRGSVIPNLLSAVQKNNARSVEDLAFFEIGPIYSTKFCNKQAHSVSGMLSGNTAEKNIYKDDRSYDFFDAKKSVNQILSVFGVSEADVEYSKASIPSWYHPGKAASIKIGKNLLGYVGELHPTILKDIKISNPSLGFEVFLENIPESHKERQGSELSDYQPVSRDFAFLLDSDIAAAKVLDGISKIDSNIIRKVKIFDIYEGEKIEKGKKSVAVNMILQSDNNTLTEEIISNLSNRIIKFVQSKLGGSIRD